MSDKTQDSVSPTSASHELPKEHPPAYEGPVRSSNKKSFALPRHVQACNYLHLSTPGHPINQKFIIDPNLPVSRSLLPPLGIEETEKSRANLSVVSNYSHVHAEVWVAPGPERELSNSVVPPSSIVRINAHSIHSPVTLIVHDDTHTRPLHITCTSIYSKVKLSLPRSFVGTIRASSQYGGVKFSAAVHSRGTMLGSVDNNIRLFVGNMNPHPDDTVEECDNGLDEVDVSSPHGGVTVCFEDEAHRLVSNPWFCSIPEVIW
ncbi:hypothetical protein DL96DRAFT_1589863 [Flagelloscypha sp. PMI_526]|nr:hypothetical protein DL96DRAFT_1589863 [Flagelloscypha sp. PMI_526]